jgi:hypothetical protein
VVLLHYMEGLNQKEIAERLDVHPATVGRVLKRAVAELKRTVEPALRESAQALRPSRQAAAHTVALIGAAGALSAASRPALAKAEGGAAQAAIASLAAPKGAAASAGFSGLLKSLPLWLATGGKMMATAKGVTALAAAAILGGGVFYFSQGGEGGAKATAQTQPKAAEKAVKLPDTAPPIPRELNARLVSLHRQELAKMGGSGKLPSMGQMTIFRNPRELWVECIMTDPLGKTLSGEVNSSAGGYLAPVAILNEEGAPMPLRLISSESGPYGQHKMVVTLDKPYPAGAKLTSIWLMPVFTADSYPDFPRDVQVQPDGSISLRLRGQMGREGVLQIFLLVPPQYTLATSAEKPSLVDKAGEYAVYGWQKHTGEEMWEMPVTLRAR